MTEPPDFEQLARSLKNFIDDHPQLVEQNMRAIAEQLRQAWNARGVADAKAVEDRLSTLVGWVTSEPYRQHLADAIKTQDR